MRPLFLVLCLSACLAAPSAFAVNVRTQPLYLLVGVADLALEIPLTQRLTLMPNVRAQADLSAVQWGLQFTHYRQPRRENGWHTGLHLQTGVVNSSNVESSYSLSLLNNHQWNWDEFNLAVGFGPQLKYEREEATLPDSTFDYWTFWPTARLSLGWQF